MIPKSSEIISENILIIHESLMLSVSISFTVYTHENKTMVLNRQDNPGIGDCSVAFAHISPSGWGFTRSLSLLDVTQKIIQ